MTGTSERHSNELRTRLLDAEGLHDPMAMKARREAMREVLEEERNFTRRIRRATITAWGLSVLLPLGFVGQPLLVLLLRGPDGVKAGLGLLLMGAQLLMFVGAFAAIIGVITLVAWLFRTRTASVASLQLRIGDLEAEITALQRESGRS